MIKTISITDEEILKHLTKQSNLSSYVCSLIKQDMMREPKLSIIATNLLNMLEQLKLL